MTSAAQRRGVDEAPEMIGAREGGGSGAELDHGGRVPSGSTAMHDDSPPAAPLALLVALALAGFAANSLLCRLALVDGGGGPAIDPASFTSIRLAAGALVLVVLAGPSRARARGSWSGALALFVYAIAFSLAYVRIGAAVGALVLFGAVQITMLGTALREGERPGPRTWIGLLAALAGIAWLVAPGLRAPDPIGAMSMALAGAAWGAYSLLGRRSREDPLGATAGNFARALPAALLVSLAWSLRATPLASTRGVVLACCSGALASGLAYAIWYAALPRLGATRAGLVQLLVPIVAAAAALPLLGETLSLRLVGATVLVVGGVALALVPITDTART